jgi:hypothetical protein
MQDKIVHSIHKLDGWLEKNGWAGYDPYDIMGHPMWLKLSQLGSEAKFIQKVERRLFFSLASRFPITCRKLLGVKKQINAKAMGLFASAYVNLYNAERQACYLEKAKQCIDWLLENPSKGYSGLCWGYPFDWQSRVFIPKGTPSGVVSSTCGHAFWQFYQQTHEKRYLEICESICKFYLNDLNIDVIDDNRICFSYTPVDNFHVHNANLFIAESLIRVGAEIDNSEFVQMGIKALNYTLAEQNPDGSFYYWGPPDKLLYNIDHYHTGFVLRALYSIYKITKDYQLFMKIGKCYHHYLENFFENNMVPKLKPGSKYPINIHSCAEAILCLSTLSEDFPEGLETLKRMTAWTIQNMQDKKGYFYYMVLPKRTIKIPYIRWAQAWMLNALSMYYQIRF